MGFKCLKATEPLEGDSLLDTIKSPGDPGTHFVHLGWMSQPESTLEPPSGVEPETPELGMQHLNH